MIYDLFVSRFDLGSTTPQESILTTCRWNLPIVLGEISHRVCCEENRKKRLVQFDQTMMKFWNSHGPWEFLRPTMNPPWRHLTSPGANGWHESSRSWPWRLLRWILMNKNPGVNSHQCGKAIKWVPGFPSHFAVWWVFHILFVYRRVLVKQWICSKALLVDAISLLPIYLCIYIYTHYYLWLLSWLSNYGYHCY